MKNIVLITALVLMLLGCVTTETYFKPIADEGYSNGINPTCPGAHKVLNLRSEKQWWILLRVYVQEIHDSPNTELRIHIDHRYHQTPEKLTRTELKELKKRNSAHDHLIVASSPFVTVQIPGQADKKYSIPIFEKPYLLNENDIDWWGSGVVISDTLLTEFTVKLPDVTVNGEAIDVPPILFQKDVQRVALVLNC